MEAVGRHITSSSLPSMADRIEVVRFFGKNRVLGNFGIEPDWISGRQPSLFMAGNLPMDRSMADTFTCGQYGFAHCCHSQSSIRMTLNPRGRKKTLLFFMNTAKNFRTKTAESMTASIKQYLFGNYSV
jgi:hypothetical protein